MINTVSMINKAALDPTRFIEECEAEYYGQVENISQQILKDKNNKIILIAGPSGSGKTTTAHILCNDLRNHGVKTEIISLDDFYLSFDLQPKNPDGTPDMESVYALDTDNIKDCFSKIISTGKCMLPHFDFMEKVSIKEHREIDISSGGMVIVEGLHALNTVITNGLPSDNLFKIYVSVNVPVLDDKGDKLLSSRKIRLIRRVLRDEIFRNTPIEHTLTLWTKVYEGEEKYLYKYKDLADVKLVTLHPYELCVYRDRFLSLVDNLKSDVDNYDYTVKVANVLRRVKSIDAELVPQNSLIREFIGGGIY